MRTLVFGALVAATLAAPAVHAAAPLPQMPSAAEIERLVDGRVAFLRAALRLTPEQEPLFDEVEAVLREIADAREAFVADHGPPPPFPIPAVERLRLDAEFGEAMARHARRLGEVVEPLAETLDDEQSRILDIALLPPPPMAGGAGLLPPGLPGGGLEPGIQPLP